MMGTATFIAWIWFGYVISQFLDGWRPRWRWHAGAWFLLTLAAFGGPLAFYLWRSVLT